MKAIDDFINRITMYKLVMFGLMGLAAISWIFSITGILPYGILRPVISFVLLMYLCYGSNILLAKIYKVEPNGESAIITALLLFFIFQPPKNKHEAFGLALAGLLAMASKYMIVRNQRHIFNPAAFGAVVVGLTGVLSSRWWIGRDSLFVFVLLLGFLVVRKIHRFPMVLSFIAMATLLAVLRSNLATILAIKTALLSFPIIFFGAFMLTEPVTTPPRRYQQIVYGLIVGLLFSSGLTVSRHSMTPEISLLIGDLLVFGLAARIRQPLKLMSIEEIGRSIRQYQFRSLAPLDFKPGQYLELTLPAKLGNDVRGNRRTFTIASSPTEKNVLFGVKHYQPSSAFKQGLAELKKGTVVSANNVAGDFLLPIDDRTKLVFIAGGIGITPFRSMIKYLTDTKHHRNVTLFYAVSDPKQIVYKDILDEAKDWLKVVYVLSTPPNQDPPKSWTGEVGLIDRSMIEKHVLDYKKRQFYISGPDAMVKTNKAMLRTIGVPRDQIKTDYFAGY